MASSSDETAAAAAARVDALLRRGEAGGAAAAAEQALADDPDSVPLWTMLSVARTALGDPVAALQAAVRALAIDPDCEDAGRNADHARADLRRRYRAALSALANPQDEGARLEAAYRAVAEADDAGVLEDAAKGISLRVFLRLAAVEEADRRWPFAEIGRDLARRGEARSLLCQLPRVRNDADRHELMEQHRIWGRAAEARAAANPVTPAPRGPRDRPRVGLLSSDLRLNAVTAFAEPLIAHAEACGVELYAYSAQPGPPDAVQQQLAQRVARFHHLPGAGAEDMARTIARDAPDVLMEMGGSTNANRVEAMAHRLAPVQISWLGYPHSTGLSTIDHILIDPYLAPSEPGLLLERPMVMPRSWIALSPSYFRAEPPPAPQLAEDRKGRITFGTAGSPYKYSAAALNAWARVLARVPGSRFLFIRPEGGSALFRRNVAAHFAREGVAADRLEFAVVRGGHLPHYGELDIALDSFPLTGGTTTCEALWMGVPVVTLAGPAFFERLGHSSLNNVGLPQLSASSVDAFVERAVALAEDRDLRATWRAECRTRIMAGALGDGRGFAGDFYRLALTAR